MRKFWLVSIILIIILIIIGLSNNEEKKERMGLIPLDSRPCNTQYPQLLGEILNKDVIIPFEYLDNFLTPGETDKQWEWLENNISSLDTVIIFTNQLFNGGLIASRHEYSQENYQENVARLKTFCQKNSDKNIILISILPRLLPSQFSDLWKYQKELTEYARLLDRHALQNKGTPLPPANVPENFLKSYLHIYTNTGDMVKEIISLAKEGLVDHYLIGQDDGEKYGLSNKIRREISPDLKGNIHFVHGADELVSLALVKPAAQNFTEGIQLKYLNEELKGKYFPFEAAPLEEVVSGKINYLNLPLNDSSPYLEVIYNDSKKNSALEKIITHSEYDYLGLMDVAFTNRGDKALFEMLKSNEIELKQQLDGYAGWNTAGNTIGTELAYLVSHRYLKNNLSKYKKADKVKALEAMIKFKYIRIAEDLVYQGVLRGKLIEQLKKRAVNPHNLGNYTAEAEKILWEMYEPYVAILNELFVGKYKVGDTTFTVDKIDSQILLPWPRTFEAKIIPEVSISLQ